MITVLDLRLKFNFPEKEYDEKTSIIVVEIEESGIKVQIGIKADSVSEVLNVSQENFESTPKILGVSLDTEFILGMAKGNNIVRTLIDIDKVLVGEEMINLAEITA